MAHLSQAKGKAEISSCVEKLELDGRGGGGCVGDRGRGGKDRETYGGARRRESRLIVEKLMMGD